jgi:hypothetical protein
VDDGTLTTRPLTFEGSELELNAVGPVTVELLPSDGGKPRSAAVSGDSLRHRVRFGGKGLREVAGRGAVRLRFTVRPGGQLYSFNVR